MNKLKLDGISALSKWKAELPLPFTWLLCDSCFAWVWFVSNTLWGSQYIVWNLEHCCGKESAFVHYCQKWTARELLFFGCSECLSENNLCHVWNRLNEGDGNEFSFMQCCQILFSRELLFFGYSDCLLDNWRHVWNWRWWWWVFFYAVLSETVFKRTAFLWLQWLSFGEFVPYLNCLTEGQ